MLLMIAIVSTIGSGINFVVKVINGGVICEQALGTSSGRRYLGLSVRPCTITCMIGTEILAI